MAKQIVIGLGTGRCGTATLAHLLSMQEDTYCGHQDLPLLKWRDDYEKISLKINAMFRRKESVVGDVAMYYLNYVDFINSIYNNVKFVCMKRDKEEVVNSFSRRMRGRNLWQIHDGTQFAIKENTEWEHCFPKYPKALSRDEAIAAYWEDYYRQAEMLERMSNFKVFPMEKFNSEEGVKELFDFLEFENPTIVAGAQANH